MKILLVAGHGQGDPGACGNGFREADLTREVVRGVADKLRTSCDAVVYDTTKNLYRYQKENGNLNFRNYDLVFEVHFNAGGGHGTEILRHENTYTKAVDNNILFGICRLGFKNRGIKPKKDKLNMNVCYRQNVPYSLLEVCFIDSSGDMGMYTENKAEIIKAIADGIKGAYGLKAEELESVNDIVWELHNRGIITDKELWLKKLEDDKNAYWLARKCVNYIVGN